MPTENRSSNTETKIQHPEGRRERFQKWVLATKHPVLGYLDGTWLARGDDQEGYADKYVQGLWVAYKEFGQPAQQPHPDPVQAFKNCTDARAYIADLFRQRLRRHDFGQYITERLAGDFAFALANWLAVEGQAVPSEIDRLHAELVSAKADKEAYSQNAIDLQRRVQNAELALKAQTQNCSTLRAKLGEAHVHAARLNAEAERHARSLAEAQALLSKAYKDMEDTIGQSWCISCHQGPEDDGVITHDPSCTFCAMEVALSTIAEPSALVNDFSKQKHEAWRRAFYGEESAEPSAPTMQIPEGYCVMPRRLTAENGAKALLLGEFKLKTTHECPECAELEEPTEGCEICDGAGEYGQRHTIPWDQIKFIYSEAVKGLALKQ